MAAYEDIYVYIYIYTHICIDYTSKFTKVHISRCLYL